MRLYRLTASFFANRYPLRLAALAAAAAELPLLAGLTYLWAGGPGTGGWAGAALLAAGAAAGVWLAVRCVGSLWEPVRVAGARLEEAWLTRAGAAWTPPTGDEATRLLTCSAAIERLLRARVDLLAGQAATDALTGLLTHAAFTETVRLRAGRDGGTVAVLEVERFEEVAALLGEGAANGVLRAVGYRIASAVRGNDLLCRWDEGRFCLYLDGLDLSGAAAVMRRVHELFAAQPLLRLEGVPLGCRHGLAPLTATGPAAVNNACGAAARYLAPAADRRGGAAGAPAGAPVERRYGLAA